MNDADLTPGWQWALAQSLVPGSGVVRVELAPGVPMFFSEIPATPPEGFRMGSRGFDSDEEPHHQVCITRPFLLSTFPVTQAQWQALMGTTLEEMQAKENSFGDITGVGPLQPMSFINWHDAGKFADAFARRFPGCGARLPREAEWEYACRAGTDTEYHTGDGEAALDAAGWYDGNAGGTTHPLGQKAMNAFGLYDMHGNVWEWCQDAWDAAAYAKRPALAENPLVDGDADSQRVIRGGSWYDTAGFCRSAFRFGFPPGVRYWFQGFRLCLSSGPVETSQARAGGQAEAEPVEGAGGSGADARATGAGGAVRGGWQGLKPPRSGRNFSPPS